MTMESQRMELAGKESVIGTKAKQLNKQKKSWKRSFTHV